MKVFLVFSCSLDGDSWLAYACKAVCADIPSAQRWIAANPATLPGDEDRIRHEADTPAHPEMTAANSWTFFGTRAEVDLLDEQGKAGEFGYVVEETEVIE